MLLVISVHAKRISRRTEPIRKCNLRWYLGGWVHAIENPKLCPGAFVSFRVVVKGVRPPLRLSNFDPGGSNSRCRKNRLSSGSAQIYSHETRDEFQSICLGSLRTYCLPIFFLLAKPHTALERRLSPLYWKRVNSGHKILQSTKRKKLRKVWKSENRKDIFDLMGPVLRDTLNAKVVSTKGWRIGVAATQPRTLA